MNNDKAQDLTAKITESINALCAETDSAKQSAIYRAWLSTLSRFHNYSWANCLLIWTQAPEATRVAGFHTWKSLGRFVKKGQTGIRILAPLIRKVEEEKNGTTERVSRPFGFKTVAVFERLSRDLRPGLHAVRVTRKHRNDAQPSQPIGSLNLLPRATIVGATVTFLSLCATFPS